MIKTYAGIPYEEIVRRYVDDKTWLCVVWTQNEEAAEGLLSKYFSQIVYDKEKFSRGRTYQGMAFQGC